MIEEADALSAALRSSSVTGAVWPCKSFRYLLIALHIASSSSAASSGLTMADRLPRVLTSCCKIVI